MTALLVFVVIVAATFATLYFMADDIRDETIGVDQFRKERAAVIEQVQDEGQQYTRLTYGGGAK